MISLLLLSPNMDPGLSELMRGSDQDYDRYPNGLLLQLEASKFEIFIASAFDTSPHQALNKIYQNSNYVKTRARLYTDDKNVDDYNEEWLIQESPLFVIERMYRGVFLVPP